jgi:3-oxoacyl-[acyl-carrier-protein] synthase II
VTIRRVAVTGVGVVSPVGIGRERYWAALAAGECGVRPVTLFDASNLRHGAAGEVPDFKPEEILGPKGLRLLDRSTRLALCASSLALQDAKLDASVEGARIGVSLGSAVGSLESRAGYYETLYREGQVGLNPALFPNTVVNSPASQVAIRFRLTACNATLSSGSASSLHALDYAAEAIRHGRARAMLAGGFEGLGEFLFVSFHQTGCLSGAARPYDRRRDGVVPGEGAAVLVLEELKSARARGASILGEYRGGGSSTDLEESVGQALDEAERAPRSVGLVCSGGSGSTSGDAAEARALNSVFGRNVQRGRSVRGGGGDRSAGRARGVPDGRLRGSRRGVPGRGRRRPARSAGAGDGPGHGAEPDRGDRGVRFLARGVVTTL